MAGALFLVGVAAAVVFVVSFPLPTVDNDAREYLALALNVSKGLGYSADGVAPAVYRPPLFASFLGGWFWVTGTSSVLSAAIFQSIVHGLGVAAAFVLFITLGIRFAWAAGGGLFLALNPLLITRVVFVLQEPTVLLVTLIAMAVSGRLIKSPSRSGAALAGAAWGLCTLAKVVTWFAPLLLLALSLLPSRLRWQGRWDHVLVVLALFAAVLAPWTARNHIQFERFIPVNEQGLGALEWNIRYARIPGEPPGAEVLARIKTTQTTQRSMRNAMWRYVAEHPRYFLFERSLRNAIYFAAPARDWWILRGYVKPGGSRTLFWISAAILHVPLFIFLLYRTRQFVAGRLDPVYGFVILFYWTYWAQHALVWGDPRYGLAVYPLLVALALPVATVRGHE